MRLGTGQEMSRGSFSFIFARLQGRRGGFLELGAGCRAMGDGRWAGVGTAVKGGN